MADIPGHMNLLYPRFTLRQFAWMFLFGLAGALIAGAYGIVHDQITFRIGPEYFTKFKRVQFHYLDPQAPMELTVVKIGFLATWWVGFFAAWFMGRITLPHEPLRKAARRSGWGVLAMILTAIVSAMIAYSIAPTSFEDPRLIHWTDLLNRYEITDTLGFIRVGYIHNASYLGGFLGLVGALIGLRLTRTRTSPSEPT